MAITIGWVYNCAVNSPVGWVNYHKLHCKKDLRDSRVCFDQTFLGLGMGQLFPAREILVGDIPAGDGNPPNFFFSVCVVLS